MSTHVGRWIKADLQSEKNDIEFKVLSVDDKRAKAMTDKFGEIDLITLDLDEQYVKLDRGLEAPEISNNLKSIAASMNIALADKSGDSNAAIEAQKSQNIRAGAGATNSLTINESEQSINEIQTNNSTLNHMSQNLKVSNPEALSIKEDIPELNLILSAIELSRKKGQASKLTFTLEIESDFDVAKIIGLAEGMNVDQEYTLQTIISQLNLSREVIQSAIIKSLK